jgi:ribosomal protein L7/L12
MPQIEVFRCPSCGASLSYEGGPETTITCQFCGTNVVIPEELRAKAAPPPAAPIEPMPPLAPAAGQALPPDQAALMALLGQIASHAASAHPDRAARVSAVMAALEQMASQGTFTPAGAGQADYINQAGMAAVQQMARTGHMIEAIKIYRLMTGSDLTTAKDAVEAMAAGAQPMPAPAPQGGMAVVEQMARSGRKIEAIKLYRQLTNAGLREAKDAVEAMEGGGGAPPYAPMAAPAPMPAPRVRQRRRGAGCGCLPILLLIAGFIALIGYAPYRLSGSYDVALSAARANPQIVKTLGEPVEADWWVWGTEVSCGSSCSAHYTIPVHGSRTSGTLAVDATMRAGGNYLDPADWTVRGTMTTGAGTALDLANRSAGLAPRATQALQASPSQVPTATSIPTEASTPTPDLAATADAMSGDQGSWPPASSINPAAPFQNWPVGLKQDDAIAVTTTVQGKNYVMTVFPKHSSSYMNIFAKDAGPLTDFYARVDLTFKQGAAGNSYAYGLVFRRVNDDYGFFGLQNDGQFKLLLVEQTGIYEQVIEKSSAIKTGAGQTNQVAVRNAGADFVFLVNGVPVWGLSKDLAAGQVGLGVDVRVRNNTAQVQFNNFEVHAPK